MQRVMQSNITQKESKQQIQDAPWQFCVKKLEVCRSYTTTFHKTYLTLRAADAT